MVCFVILHYMAVDETVVCVESILHNVEGEKRLILVDNASPNGSVKELEEKYGENPLVDVLETGENLGFARGNNFGYRYAVEKYAPSFVVVMNNDMEIRQKDFIKQLEKSYEEHRFAILGPDIYSTKKKYHQNPQTRKILTRKELAGSVRVLTVKNALRFMIPVKWLGQPFIDEAERLKEVNERAYQHEYLGLPVGSGSEVFPNLEIRAISDEEIQEQQYVYCGVDFGFASDPACCVRVAYDRRTDSDGGLFFRRLLGGKACPDMASD